MKEQEVNLIKLHLSFGDKKAFIFALDAVFALIIVIITLTIANLYIARIEHSSTAELQIAKRGNDIIKLITEENTTKNFLSPYGGREAIDALTLDGIANGNNIPDNNINFILDNIIENIRGQDIEISELNVRMKITSKCNKYVVSGGGGITTVQTIYSSNNGPTPDDRFIAGGQIFYIIPDNVNPSGTYYCIGEYQTWLE